MPFVTDHMITLIITPGSRMMYINEPRREKRALSFSLNQSFRAHAWSLSKAKCIVL